MSEMAALATLFNPLVEGEKELLTFWNNNVGDLTLAQRQNPQKPAEIFYQKVAKSTGLVKNPSSIVALLLNNTVNVYGVTATNPAKLKRLSPTVEPLAYNITIEVAASLAGAKSPDGSTGWLYYLSLDDDEVVIREHTIGSTDEPVQLDDLPRKDTYLAAAHYTSSSGVEQRRVIYQTKRKTIIHYVDVITGDDADITGTDIAKAPTPLAAVTAKSAAGEETVYVYFVDQSNNLNLSTITDKSSAKPIRVTKGPNSAPPVSVWSQLSVTAGEKYNFVSYVTEKSGKQLLTIFADERL